MHRRGPVFFTHTGRLSVVLVFDVGGVVSVSVGLVYAVDAFP